MLEADRPRLCYLRYVPLTAPHEDFLLGVGSQPGSLARQVYHWSQVFRQVATPLQVGVPSTVKCVQVNGPPAAPEQVLLPSHVCPSCWQVLFQWVNVPSHVFGLPSQVARASHVRYMRIVGCVQSALPT